MSRLGPSASRILALDLTKGALVVFMVAYHAFNYSTERHLGFAYLSFLPPSFILITGFLLSNVYLARYAATDRRLTFRLLARGTKLLLLFTALNIAAMSLLKTRARGEMPGVSVFFDHWFDVFITGNARLAVFEVLLPVAYLLLLAPLFLLINSVHRFALPILTVAAVAALVVLEQNGIAWANVQLLSAGLVGMLLGRVPMASVSRLTSLRWLLLLAYAGCFWIARHLGFPYPLQIVAAAIALAAIYGFCASLSEAGWGTRRLELLGQYSLIAYIAQIALLVVLSRLIGLAEPLSLDFLGLFASALLLTAVAVELTALLRAKFKPANFAYKAVFA